MLIFGNILTVITDCKIAKDTTADATHTPQFYMPDVYSVQNYYAFGQSMPGWSATAVVNDPKKYRFGYNGKEDDDEWAKQDYGFRIYDGRIGRFLSVDPLMKDYPSLTTYQFASNSPISGIDLDGLEYYYAADGTYLGHSGTMLHVEVRLISESDFTRIKTASPSDLNFQSNEQALLDASVSTKLQNKDLLMAAGLVYGESGLDDIAMRAVANSIFNRKKYYAEQGDNVSLGTTVLALLGNYSIKDYNENNPRFRMFVGNSTTTDGATQAVDLEKNANGRNSDPEMKNAIKYVFDANNGKDDYSNGAIGWHSLDIVRGKNEEAVKWRTWLLVKPEHRLYGFQGMPKSVEKPRFESVLVRKGKVYGASVFYNITEYGKEVGAANLPAKYKTKK
jgi:RHS repeat-associated protein